MRLVASAPGQRRPDACPVSLAAGRALEGIQHFGQEVEYLGAAEPLVGHEGLADVLIGKYENVECWFYFDPAGGDLLALEMYPSENVDPCEVYFSGYHDVDGRRLQRMEVRSGDGPFGAFRPRAIHL